MPNALLDDVPGLGPYPNRQPRNSLRDLLENFSIGMGHGISNNLESLSQLLTDPYAGTQMLEGLYQAASHPRQTANALGQYAKEAVGSPLNAGFAIGGMLDPSMVRSLGKPIMYEMSNIRAKAGGETASANGYFYKGGQFLPSTDAPPGTWRVEGKLVKSRKRQVGPGQYEMQPGPNAKSVYEMAAVGAWTRRNSDNKLEIVGGIKDNNNVLVTPETRIGVGDLTLQDAVDAWNNGQRWFSQS